jgi:hypothetical protein
MVSLKVFNSVGQELRRIEQATMSACSMPASRAAVRGASPRTIAITSLVHLRAQPRQVSLHRGSARCDRGADQRGPRHQRLGIAQDTPAPAQVQPAAAGMAQVAGVLPILSQKILIVVKINRDQKISKDWT